MPSDEGRRREKKDRRRDIHTAQTSLLYPGLTQTQEEGQRKLRRHHHRKQTQNTRRPPPSIDLRARSASVLSLSSHPEGGGKLFLPVQSSPSCALSRGPEKLRSEEVREKLPTDRARKRKKEEDRQSERAESEREEEDEEDFCRAV